MHPAAFPSAMNPALHPDTPPPPPPKPGSHEVSRGGTPQINPSTPHQYQDPRYGLNGMGSQGSHQHSVSGMAQANPLPQAPTAEEGWLPDAVKDKSYVTGSRLLKEVVESNRNTPQDRGPPDHPERPESPLRAR